jgi:hypothetical protein
VLDHWVIEKTESLFAPSAMDIAAIVAVIALVGHCRPTGIVDASGPQQQLRSPKAAAWISLQSV